MTCAFWSRATTFYKEEAALLKDENHKRTTPTVRVDVVTSDISLRFRARPFTGDTVWPTRERRPTFIGRGAGPGVDVVFFSSSSF